MRIGIIGGSGSAVLLDGVTTVATAHATPWGEPSGPVLSWRAGGHEVFFLARHGTPAAIPPHAVNYRANVWVFRELGVDHLIGINAVGGISSAATPGRLVIPDQLIDYTWGRQHTYSGPPGLELRHVEFTEPFCPRLRARLLATAGCLGLEVLERGTYGVTQGPRLETAAEIDRLETDGCAIVGMTAMPEAALARETDLSYALCCLVVNHGAGRGPGRTAIHAQMAAALGAGMAGVRRLLNAFTAA